MRSGVFFYLELVFPAGQLESWKKAKIESIITEDYEHENLDEIDLPGEWFQGIDKKQTVESLFEKLSQSFQKGKLYFPFVKTSATTLQVSGYFTDKQMEKYFEPLANACCMAASFNGTGKALFFSDQNAGEVNWKTIDAGIIINTDKTYKIVGCHQILYPGNAEIPEYYKHSLATDIWQNYSSYYKQHKPKGIKNPEYAGKFGYMDLSGNFILEPKWLSAGVFASELAPVSEKDGGLWGYIDTTGKYVIEPVFDEAYAFKDGIARVRKQTGEDGSENYSSGDYPYKYGFINTKGEFIIQPEYVFAEDFSEGMAQFSTLNSKGYKDKSGFINLKGEVIISAIYQEALAFYNGLAFVFQNKKWGAINKQGDLVIKPAFEYESYFSEDLAAIYSKGKYGYINTKGDFKIKPKYDSASFFSEEIAPVKDGDSWYLINKDGEKLRKLKEDFEYVDGFRNGLALVIHKGLAGLINKEGKIIVKPQFSHLQACSDQLLLVQIP